MLEKNLTKLLKYAIYFPSVYLGLGCFYLIIYFKIFKINIFQYATLQDAALAYLNESLLMIGYIGYLLVFVLSIYEGNNQKENDNRAHIIMMFKRSSVMMGIMLIMGIVFSLIASEFIHRIILLNSLVVVFAIGGYYTLLLRLNKVQPFVNSIELFNLLYLFGILLVFTLGISLFEGIKTKELNEFSGTEICTSDSIIKIEKNLSLIGKTEKYMFIHNFNTNSNLILPVDQIKYVRYNYKCDTIKIPKAIKSTKFKTVPKTSKHNLEGEF